MAIAIAILAGWTRARMAVKSRQQLFAPLATSFLVCTVIYLAVMSEVDSNAGRKGADLFHLSAVIVLCVAPLVGAVLNRIRMAGEPLAYVAWALVGACLPPVILFTFVVLAAPV